MTVHTLPDLSMRTAICPPYSTGDELLPRPAQCACPPRACCGVGPRDHRRWPPIRLSPDLGTALSFGCLSRDVRSQIPRYHPDEAVGSLPSRSAGQGAKMGRITDYLTPATTLPVDGTAGALVARVWLPQAAGPAVTAIRADGVYDISRLAPTVRDLCEMPDPAAIVRSGKGQPIGALADILANTPEDRRTHGKPWLLAPIDLQAIKAAGVTFPLSLLERVIEEQARGAPEKAEAIRASIAAQLGGNLAELVPGSPQAAELKRVLIEQGAWSQYLEVGIGPDAEIFTKAQPMAAIGHGMAAGLHPRSSWNNPEPEVVLVVNSKGAIVGATLGNDVNLRDVEGRSALLLSKAKDNNASTAIGPFVRLFDRTFTLDDVRRTQVTLNVT